MVLRAGSRPVRTAGAMAMSDRSQISRFGPGQDGWLFRRDAFTALSSRFRKPVSEAIGVLRDLQFELPAIGEAHQRQLQPELLFRHSIPFCITEDAYFQPRDTTAVYLAALLAGHTLALTHLDYHLDGSMPAQASAATAQKMDFISAATYAVRMVYAAGSLLGEVSTADAMFREVFGPISGFVLLRMYEDSQERYLEEFLRHPERRLREYLESPTSRLLGSGYWELMPRGCFVSHGMTAPPELIDTLRGLRRLRQVVDEIADFEDDVRSGLVTIPLLFALRTEGAAGAISDAVTRLWHLRHGRPDVPDDELVHEVRKLAEDFGAFESSYRLANCLWEEACSQCEGLLGDRGKDYLLLLDLKRAKLEILAENGWHNEPTEPSFAV